MYFKINTPQKDKYTDMGMVNISASFYLEKGDEGWEKYQKEHHVIVSVIPKEGYQGKVDEMGMPVDREDFNKWVEMGALEVPCVTSYVTPYKEHMTDDNGIFIENNDKDGWIDGISMLIEDKSMRLSMAESAHQTVRDNFDINKEWKQWENAYRSLL